MPTLPRRSPIRLRDETPRDFATPWEAVFELYRDLRGIAHESLVPHRLLVSEYHTLLLCERGPAPLKSIARALGVTPAATTDLVRRLTGRRLLCVSPHATDGRSRVASLTPLGKRRLVRARASHSRALRELGVRLSPAAREGLEAGVRALRSAVTDRQPH